MSRNDAISKRAKLTGIKRFFKDIPQDEQTNVSDEHNRQPSSISSLSLIPEQPVVYLTLESSTTEIAGSSQSCVPCAVILSLAENDEQDLQLNFNSNDSCCQQSISGSRNSSIAVCVDDTPQHLDSDDPDPLDLPTPGSCYLHGSSSSISVSSMSIANNITSLGKPNQPDISVIPVQLLPSRSLHFQKNWYQEYQWLHYSSGLKKVLCFYCSKASALGLIDLARCKDPAFILNGFDNWKKAHEKFRSHQMSRTHQLAINQISAIKRPVVNVQMNTLKLKEQEISRNSLLKLFTTIRYLLRQGSAIRGHDETSGNYFQLLKLRSEDDPDLGMYLKRTTNFISPRGQEEMMEMFSHCIVREVVSDIQKHGCFAIIVDGTQDVSGREQESICLRHVNSDLHVREDFVGIYEIPTTTSESIAGMVFDVLTRFALPLSNLRAQTYDGAANMSGHYTGCQARVRQCQPLALYFHCAPHISNLVMQNAVISSQLVRNALQWTNELGVLMNRSGKYRAMFRAICVSNESESLHPSAIKPLCPTRWLCRLPAIQSALDNYSTILLSLKEMADVGVTESATKANGLLDRFQKGETLLGLMIAARPVALLEQLNSVLQAKSATVSGMLETVKISTESIRAWYSDEVFHEIFIAAEEKGETYQLDPLEIPRRRCPPKRYADQVARDQPANPEEHYKKQYLEYIDAVSKGLSDRYDLSKSGLAQYVKLENMLTSGKVNLDVISKYPELDKCSLQMQLEMFKHNYKPDTLNDAKLSYRSMTPEVRSLFPQVVVLLKLLLVCPVSSCECERSFSALRRLKTWLRATMTQPRLNCVSVCHVHREKLDKVDVRQLARIFIEQSDNRRKIFGTFH